MPSSATQRTTGLSTSAMIGYLPLVVFAILFATISLQLPNFLTFTTFDLILRQSIPTVIVCLGLAPVVMAGGDDVVSGGIDLSIPASAVLAAGIIADQVVNHGNPILFAIGVSLIAAIAVGVTNAILVVRIGMTPLLATLARWSYGCGTGRSLGFPPVW